MKINKVEVNNGFRYEVSNDTKIITFYSESDEQTNLYMDKAKELLNK